MRLPHLQNISQLTSVASKSCQLSAQLLLPRDIGPPDNWQLRQMTKSKDLSCAGNNVMSTSYGESTYVGISNSQTKGNGNKRTINLCIFFSKQNNKNSGKTPSNICQRISNNFKLGYTINKQPGFWPLTRPMHFSDQSICDEFLSVQHYGLNMAVSPCECHVSHLETLYIIHIYIHIYVYICMYMYIYVKWCMYVHDMSL